MNIFPTNVEVEQLFSAAVDLTAKKRSRNSGKLIDAFFKGHI